MAAAVGDAVGALVGASVPLDAALWNRVAVPRLFVGSNGTQPIPRKYTSGHACSWLPVTFTTRSPSTT